MKIFETFMKIMRKHLKLSLIYISVFMVVGIMMTKSSSDSEDGYKARRLRVSVTDLDDTEASRAVVDFIAKNHDIVKVSDDMNKQLDSLYYSKTHIILTIENGYSEKLEHGETTGLFNELSVPGTNMTQLFDSQLNRYIGLVSATIAGGNTPAEASAKASEVLSQEIETVMLNDSGKGSEKEDVQNHYFLYLAYIFISVLINTLCQIHLSLKNKDINNRINCSGVSSYSQLLQVMLGTFVFVIGVYVLLIGAGVVLFGGSMFTEKGMLSMLNAFVFIIVVMMICLFISSFSPSMDVISLIANVIGLGMSFLCGVFVPQQYLGDVALSIGKFLPVYWYVKGCNTVMEKEGEIFSVSGFLICIGVQIAFAAAFFCLTMLISKNRRQTES
ncbi:MAG: ABC transporter permease [Ruminococcus sp.]|nr:ABC transporter permease [Ruminococcus sp.]